MRRRVRGIVVAAAIATAGAAPVAAQSLPLEIEHQGVKRGVIVVSADAAKPSRKPLLIVLHGRREATAPHRSSPRLDELAGREGFVVAYPAGLDGRWNYPHQTSPPSKAGDADADDVGFIVALIDRLIADNVADKRRVYVSGASNGGLLTYAIMCLHGDRIAAAAPLIANMSERQLVACKPVRAVPIVAIAGTADRIMPYDGWLYPTGRLTSIAETFEFWRRQHACTGQASRMLPPGQVDDTTRIMRVDWTGCARDNAVRLYRVQGGGHTLPSLVQPAPAQDSASERRSTVFETSVEVWSFLKQWSLP